MTMVGPGPEFPMEASHDRRLEAAREAFPDWDILEVLGGFIAVPKGTPVLRGMFLDVIVEKIRRQDTPDLQA